MSQNFKQRLSKISTLIFDVDGVLSDGKVFFMSDGTTLRNLNLKDSYALQLAIKKGFRIIIITGGSSQPLKDSLHRLGIEYVFLKQHDKLACYKDCMNELGFTDEQALYMGDDLPDYEVMQRVNVACCPADAAVEIKEVSIYVSPKKGGDGCVRDIVEQVMRVQNKWEISKW
jgi:3-deoxy-D-manno-octulosonate 8-phosphate phosphatase (KDO 8-P phosphatase)